jgi:hypothetical protein
MNHMWWAAATNDVTRVSDRAINASSV